MKRPLCTVVLMVEAVLMLLILLFPEKQIISDVPDRAFVTKTGTIERKEIKTSSYTGGEELVIRLRTDNGKRILLYVDDMGYDLPVGCVLKVRGKVRLFGESRNPGEFDSREYYRILKTEYSLTDVSIIGIGGQPDYIGESMFKARIYLEGVLDRCMNEEDAGVMKAILLGDKNCLRDDIEDSFKQNGVIHILAVSGLHISLLGMSLYKLLRRAGVWLCPSAFVSVTVMYLYGIMCGMSTSAFRAIVMFAVHLGADVVGRTYDMLSAMALAAALLVIEQPLYLMHSGFLMSFGAIIGIGYVLPAMPDIIKEGKLKILSGSLSIALATFPVQIMFYYTYPVYSVILNLLILPCMAALMLFGIISIAAGMIFVPLGIAAGTADHIILWWFKLCCSFGKELPGNTWYVGHPETIQTVVYVLALIMFVGFSGEENRTWVKEKAGLNERAVNLIRSLILMMGLIVLCIRIRPQLRITVLDVGQGDGIVVEAEGKNYLIDGGSTSKKNIGKYQLIPYLAYRGIQSLDAVILTHEDEDHMSGISELLDARGKSRGSIGIKHLILPDIAEKSKGENYRKLVDKAGELGIPVSYVGRKDRIADSSMYIECLGPERGMNTDEPNAYSTVLFMRLGQFTGLFTGDVDGAGQDSLKKFIVDNGEKYSDITFLKVAHHGSRYTTDERFLSLIQPRIAVISCGIDNRYHHPHKELMERLSQSGAGIYVTAEKGAITLETDGEKLSVRSYLENG